MDHRMRMECSGLMGIIDGCRSLGIAGVDKQLDDLEHLLEEDEKQLLEQENREILRTFSNAEDIWNALCARTKDSRSNDYLLSMLRHLLLIKAEGPELTHYYQLLDSLVTDVVMDAKVHSAEARIGHSVQRLIVQLTDVDRFQMMEDEAKRAREQANKLRMQKEGLEEEISQGFDGLVGQLKAKVGHMQDKLSTARDTTSRLQDQLVIQKEGYEERIRQLEAQIMELFRMLKETGKDAQEIIDANSGSMNRKELIETLNRHLERSKTINILEGRGRRRAKNLTNGGENGSDGSGEDSKNSTPRKKDAKRRGFSGPGQSGSMAKAARVLDGQMGRESQFMDAEEADVQQQIKHQLAAGINIVSVTHDYYYWLTSFTAHPRGRCSEPPKHAWITETVSSSRSWR